MRVWPSFYPFLRKVSVVEVSAIYDVRYREVSLYSICHKIWIFYSLSFNFFVNLISPCKCRSISISRKVPFPLVK